MHRELPPAPPWSLNRPHLLFDDEDSRRRRSERNCTFAGPKSRNVFASRGNRFNQKDAEADNQLRAAEKRVKTFLVFG